MWDFFVGLGKFLWVLFQVIVLFNLLIVVHELGHYWAAKWRGLKVEKFQIWFGKTIWQKEINGVKWGLGTIPMGGFVALPQMAPMGAIEGGSDDRAKLPSITPADKIIVAFAGPLFSFLLAVFFAVLVWQLGKPSHVSISTRTVGYTVAGYPAHEVLLPGDEILEIDGVAVRGFGGAVDSVTERIVFSEGDKVEVLVKREGAAEPVKLSIVPRVDEKGAFERPGTRKVGAGPAEPSIVRSVSKGSPAAEADLQAGDEIISANGEKIFSPGRIGQLVTEGEGAPIVLEVKRGEEQLKLTLTPRKPLSPDDAGYLAGLEWDRSQGSYLARPGPPPTQQLADSATAMFRTLKAVTSKDSNVSVKHMSSAVGIGGYYYDALSSENGWRLAFVISVLINVNLALLNLLPLPVLDGGHITMAVYEWIRKRPLNVRVLEYVQVACVLLLLGFMVFVTFYDISDRVPKGKKAEPIRWVS